MCYKPHYYNALIGCYKEKLPNLNPYSNDEELTLWFKIEPHYENTSSYIEDGYNITYALKEHLLKFGNNKGDFVDKNLSSPINSIKFRLKVFKKVLSHANETKSLLEQLPLVY